MIISSRYVTLGSFITNVKFSKPYIQVFFWTPRKTSQDSGIRRLLIHESYRESLYSNRTIETWLLRGHGISEVRRELGIWKCGQQMFPTSSTFVRKGQRYPLFASWPQWLRFPLQDVQKSRCELMKVRAASSLVAIFSSYTALRTKQTSVTIPLVKIIRVVIALLVQPDFVIFEQHVIGGWDADWTSLFEVGFHPCFADTSVQYYNVGLLALQRVDMECLMTFNVLPKWLQTAQFLVYVGSRVPCRLHW